MENSIVGREKEITELKKYLSSEQSEFIAVYGRRRVGKTFLIKELLEEQFCFRMTGKENARLGEQLLNFSYALSDFFDDNRVPKNWTEAFRMLSKNIEKQEEGAKIIFIDELPWLDTQKSRFLLKQWKSLRTAIPLHQPLRLWSSMNRYLQKQF